MRKKWVACLVAAGLFLGACQSQSEDADLSEASSSSTSITTAAPPTTTTTTTTTAAATTTTTTTIVTKTTNGPETTTTTGPTTTTSTAAQTTTTTAAEVEKAHIPTVHEVSISTVEFMPGLSADIHAPTQPGRYPVTTLSFGGSWTIQNRTQLSGLANHLASRGVVAINADYRTLSQNGRIPSMVEEVACLAAAAPRLAQPHLIEPAGPVWLVGFSSGAHLAALVALSDDPTSPNCPYEPGEIAGMIGLAGPYDLDELWNEGIFNRLWDAELIVENIPEIGAWLGRGDQLAMRVFLRLLTGATPESPDRWDALNPIRMTENHPQRRFLLLTGAEDHLVSLSQSERFASALAEAGHDVSLEVVPNADHLALFYLRAVEDAILSFLGTAH